MIDKKQIIENTASLFKSAGIRNNTMDDIAGAAGISKKTLYQYVTDKNELIDEVIELEFQKTKSVLNFIVQTSGNSIEELLRFNAFIIRFLDQINPTSVAELKKLYKPIHNKWKGKFQEQFFRVIKQSICDGKVSGIFRSDINEELITRLHTDKMDSLHDGAEFWNLGSKRTDVIKEMVTYYIRGLVTKQGEVILNKQLEHFNDYITENI